MHEQRPGEGSEETDRVPSPFKASMREITRRRALQVGAATVGALAVEVTSARAGSQPLVVGGRAEVLFDEGWRFVRGNPANAHSPAFADSSWRKLDVPHDWSIEDLPGETSDDGGATSDPSTLTDRVTPTPSSIPEKIGPFDPAKSAGAGATGYTVGGVGWYRKHFTLPHTASDAVDAPRHVELRFDGVYDTTDVWLNGVHLGFHPYGYTTIAYDLTPHLKKTGTNVLAVRVKNVGKNSRWYAGSGIYRHTWLTTTSAVRIPLHGIYVTTPVADRKRSVARVEVSVANLGHGPTSAQVRVTVLDPHGRAVASELIHVKKVAAGATSDHDVHLSIKSASLWSPDSPSLYRATAEVLVDGQVVDTASTAFGIRSLQWDENGFKLNGKIFKIKGANNHSSHGPVGAASLARTEEREVEILKAAGFNAIRTAHNPVSVEKLEACDRLGMLVWDEFTDMWDTGKNPDDYSVYFAKWWRRDLTSMILRDRNHPSVVIWSLGNEIVDKTKGKRGRQMATLVRSLDRSRPVSQGATPFIHIDDPMYTYIDVADFHYDIVATGNTLGMQGIVTPEQIHATFPKKAVSNSESWPQTIYDDWQATLANPWWVGSWVWTGFDYIGESGIGAPRFGATTTVTGPFGNGLYPFFDSFCGDVDLIGQRKPQNFWRAVVYGTSPIEMLVERPAPAGTQQFPALWSYYDELESWTWDVPSGQEMTVHVYTSGDTVTLTLNGTAVATNAVAAADKQLTTFVVPYAPGELVAVAYRSGTKIGGKTLTTTGTPSALKLSPDRKGLTTSRDDLAHVLVEVLDDQGRLVPDAVTEVSFQITGHGELIAAGSGNPQNVDSFTQPKHHTWHGRALAILRPAKTPGAINVIATAPGLKPAHLSISVGLAKSANEEVATRQSDMLGLRLSRTSAAGVMAWPLMAYWAGAALIRRRNSSTHAEDREADQSTGPAS